MTRYKGALNVLLLAVVGLPATGGAYAQDTTDHGYLMPESWYFSLGYVALEETNTSFSLHASDGDIGTVINYQRDLGGDSATNAGRFRFSYRFNQKHRFDFSTYSVKRDSDRQINIRIEYGDVVYEDGDRVTSSIDTTIYKAAYSYSLYHSNKSETALSAGLHVVDYSVKLADAKGIEEARDITAPLPVVGLRTSYGFTPKWIFNFWFENFYIDLNDKFRGSLVDAAVGIEWRPFKNFGTGFQFVRTALDVQVDTSKYTGELDDVYRGAELYVAAFF